jgi:membrane fusion protein (multidrug efflux system)
VEPAGRGDIASHYSATATLEPDKEAEVLARASGVVLEILVEEGDQVAKGQELLVIEDDEYRWRLKSAETELHQRRTRHQRLEQMLEYQEGMIAPEELEEAESAYRSAVAAHELAALNLSYTRVDAPFSGLMVSRFVDQGQTVNVGTRLFTLSDMGRLLARVHVPAKQFQSIRTDQPVELTLDSSGEQLTGTIDLISPVIDPQSGTIKVTVEISQYPESARAGDFAEVRIVTEQHLNTILIPKAAVVSEKGTNVVYLAEENKARRQVVELGFQNESHIEITDGLAEGQQVVIQGQRSLKDGQTLKILEAIDFEDTGEPETEA